MGLINKKKDTKGIEFNEKLHKYYYDGKELMSATTWIGEYFVPEFNSLFASINKSKSNKKNGSSITNPTTLRKYWRLQGERASHLGTATHVFAEMYHLDKSTVPDTGYDRAVIAAYEAITKKWEIVAMEEIVYSVDYLLAGCVDLVLRNRETGEIGLGDWKTTTDMHKSYNKMLNEMSGVKASPLNKYALQLQLYNVLGSYGASHTNMFVIQLRKDGTYQVYSARSKDKKDVLNDYSNELTSALEKRRITKTHPLLQI